MKKRILIVALLLMYFFPLISQDKVELFGYLESQLMGVSLENQFIQLFSNKLRVDLKSKLSEKITFAANFNFKTFHGKKQWNILDFLPDKAVSEVPEGMEPFYVLPFEDEYYLDNAYIKLSFKYVDLLVGKQQISLGTGYVWNPMDVFNVKDYLDPTYEQPGHNAVRVDVPVGSSSTITALYSPEGTWGDSAKMLQFKGRISHFDYYLVAIQKAWHFHDYTRFDEEKMNFVENPEKRQLFGLSTVGELFGVGVWVEYAYNKMEVSEDFHELVFGIDYTFSFQTYVMVEYYMNTLGKIDYKEYSLNDWMRMMAQEQKAITRDQIYVFLRQPLSELTSIGLTGLYSISDGSLALVPTLSYSLSDNVEIYAYLNFNIGKEGTVFASDTGRGGLIRIRLYF